MDLVEKQSGRPLRVLMVSQRMVPYVAGAELQALWLSRALVEAGAEVGIVTTKFSPGLARHEIIEGVPVRRLATLRGSEQPTSGRATLVKMSQVAAMASYVFARARSFDLVHAHCLSASAVGAVIGARLRNLPVMIKPSLGGADGELRKLLDSGSAPWTLPLLRRVDRFAVLHQRIADELAAVGIGGERMESVTNGIDLRRFCPPTGAERQEIRARLGLPPGPLLLFVGQLIERKGVSLLLEAGRLVQEAEAEATLVFVGVGEEAERIGREAAAGARVMPLGQREDVPDLLRAADLFVLPSRNESFGNAVVEAMASGLPVIVGNSGVASHLHIDGEAGRVVEASDARLFAAAILEILRSPALRRQFGERGRRLVERYDFGRVAQNYLEIYRSMMARKGVGRAPE